LRQIKDAAAPPPQDSAFKKLEETSLMSELVMPFAIMALTLVVLGGLILCFQKWLAIRDRLVPPPGEGTRGGTAFHAAE
jgi:hypothetical protein